MMTKEGSTSIVNFMTPGAGVLVQARGRISHLVKMHYFLKNLLWCMVHSIQTKCIVMMNKEESTSIVNFMTPEAGLLVKGPDHISQIVKSILLLYSGE